MSNNDQSIFSQNFTVRGSEITPNYLLKPQSLIQMLFECFAYECAEKKLAGYDLQAEGKSWILSELMVVFEQKSPRWKEPVTIKKWTRQLGGLRFLKDFQALHDDTVVASATSNWLIINEANRRPIRASEYADKYDILEQESIPGFAFDKIEPFGDALDPTRFEVQLNDIDFNSHLNSIRYIIEAFESVPVGFRQEHNISSCRVKFINEVHIGDALLTLTYFENNRFYHHQFRESDGKEVARLVTEWQN